MGNYAALAKREYTNGEYAIQALREIDILDVMRWRNDQIDVLRQSAPLTKSVQEAYYRDVVVPGFPEPRPSQILFSYLDRGHCIGYGGLTNIDWVNGRAELSFLIETGRRGNAQQYRQDFSSFLHLMRDVAFGELGLHRIFTETFDIRPEHVLVLEENGFRLEGRLREHAIVRGQRVDSLIHGCVKGDRHA
jgi:RimJ/RimL family protein N-acetyltransferase